jgi:uncharacterized membrane protein YfcA
VAKLIATLFLYLKFISLKILRHYLALSFTKSNKTKYMDITTVLILALIGLVAGTLGGMVGLGGGLIIVPAMMYLLGADQKTAQGTSIAIMLPPIGLFAAINYYKAGYINVKYAAIIAVTFLLGGYLGSKLAIALPEAVIKKVFAALMIVTALKMMLTK